MTLVQLTIAQPCSESWAAMTPTATGRHCAACAKTVIDFTHLSDAEILEQLARAGRGGACGRFRAGQLQRPLQPVVVPPAARWRAWLAAAAAVWGLRESAGVAARAQVPTEQRAVPAPAAWQDMRRNDYEGAGPAPAVVRGIVVDAATGEALPGVSVLIHGTTIGTATNMAGEFSLTIPADRRADASLTIDIIYLGYDRQTKSLADFAAGQPLRLQMALDTRVLGGIGMEVVVAPLKMPPAPWHPRRFYYWSKYWLTRPFRSY